MGPDPTPWATDKVDLGYLPTYQRLAERLGDNISILEVGARDGGGMHMLRDVFNTPYVVGVDIDPDKARDAGEDGYGAIITSAQEHPGLPLVLADRMPFDLIVDDASHKGWETAVTLANLWPLVAPGGAYVIEDWNFFEGPQVWQNAWQKVLGKFLSFSGTTEPHPYSGILDDVAGVEITHGMIVIHKGA